MSTTEPPRQEITMSSKITSLSSFYNKEITSNNQKFTETKKSTVIYVSQTKGQLNYENITLPYSEEVVSSKFDLKDKEEMYQPSTVIITITVMGSLIILMILIAILAVKCNKYRRDQIIQRRRNRIFREVGMIPMRTVINEQYMGSEER